MAKIDLRPRLTGRGYVGTVDVGRLDLGPTLSWADSQALQSIAASGQSISASAGSQAAAVASALAWVGSEISGAIGDLERELGLRLAEQTEVLGRQLEALERIELALRHPAKVRAAERLVDAGRLLDQRRFDRALPLAEEAISDDPLNPAAFGAAGWALLGLGKVEESHDHFAEAAVAAEGTEHAAYTRRQARVAFALDRSAAAEQALRQVVGNAATSAAERAACSYDLAIYTAPHDPGEAGETMRQATSYDSRYAVWALVDPIVHEHPTLLKVALSQLESLRTEIDAEMAQLRSSITTAEQCLSEPIDLTLSAREELVKVLGEATAFAGSRESSEPVPDRLGQISRRVPLQAQLRELKRVVETLTIALGRLDEQMQALPRIRELMAVVLRLTRELKDRQDELQRLGNELYEEYQAAGDYTQALSNSLHRYHGRKYKRKLRERDEASARYKAATERWMDARRQEFGTDLDPESERISGELARARSELFDLNPAARHTGPTSLFQPAQPPASTQIPVGETLQEMARSEMDAALAERAREET
jgi:tetratricopeptide (TPR) repeat protein